METLTVNENLFNKIKVGPPSKSKTSNSLYYPITVDNQYYLTVRVANHFTKKTRGMHTMISNDTRQVTEEEIKLFALEPVKNIYTTNLHSIHWSKYYED